MWRSGRRGYLLTLATAVAAVSLAVHCAGPFSVFCNRLRRQRSTRRALQLARRCRSLSEAELLADELLLQALVRMIIDWRTDFSAARVAADAMCRQTNRFPALKDTLHSMGVTDALADAIRDCNTKDPACEAVHRAGGQPTDVFLRFGDDPQAAAPQAPGGYDQEVEGIDDPGLFLHVYALWPAHSPCHRIELLWWCSCWWRRGGGTATMAAARVCTRAGRLLSTRV
eukprot:COSAG05_NODE_39_length_27555_cov_750.282925_18_plen_227_part_00